MTMKMKTRMMMRIVSECTVPESYRFVTGQDVVVAANSSV